MRKKLYLLSIFFLVSTVLIGCSGLSKTINKNFNEDDAINKVLIEKPEFPAKPGEIKTLQVRTGGPSPGLLVKAELTTKVEKVDNETYMVTLTKAWQLNKNNNQPISYWRYKVSLDRTTLTGSEDNDYKIQLIR